MIKAIKKIYKLIRVSRKIIKLKETQKGFRHWRNGAPKTYCNIASYMILRDTGYNILSMLNPKGIYWTSIKSLLANLKMGVEIGEVQELQPDESQLLANRGETILVVSGFPKYYHTATVYPTFKKYNHERGVKLAQAGWYNGIFYISDFEAWGRTAWNDPKVKYYKIAKTT